MGNRHLDDWQLELKCSFICRDHLRLLPMKSSARGCDLDLETISRKSHILIAFGVYPVFKLGVITLA